MCVCVFFFNLTIKSCEYSVKTTMTNFKYYVECFQLKKTKKSTNVFTMASRTKTDNGSSSMVMHGACVPQTLMVIIKIIITNFVTFVPSKWPSNAENGQ